MTGLMRYYKRGQRPESLIWPWPIIGLVILALTIFLCYSPLIFK